MSRNRGNRQRNKQVDTSTKTDINTEPGDNMDNDVAQEIEPEGASPRQPMAYMVAQQPDVFDRARIIYINEPITDEVSKEVTKRLLQLELEAPDRDITIYLDTPGGSVQAGFQIIDMMNAINCDVRTVAVGKAFSMGAMILLNGTDSKRFALPNANVMTHQLSGGALGSFNNINDRLKYISALQSTIENMILDRTNITKKNIRDYMDHDYFMMADEALQLGLVDEIGLPSNSYSF